jgi:hypothetical protein
MLCAWWSLHATLFCATGRKQAVLNYKYKKLCFHIHGHGREGVTGVDTAKLVQFYFLGPIVVKAYIF